MEKKLVIKYPQAISLFEFCKDALRHKYDNRIRIIDQDVGTLVGFEPADCSHWKRGQKDVRNLAHLKNISRHLAVDEAIPVGIALGEITAEEGSYELRGYINHELDEEKESELKKQFFQRPSQWGVPQLEKSFAEVFELKHSLVKEFVSKILNEAYISEAPVNPNTVMASFPKITLQKAANSQDAPMSVKTVVENSLTAKAGAAAGKAKVSPNDTYKLVYSGDIKSPCLRFFVMKELFMHLYRVSHRALGELGSVPKEMVEEHASLFAMHILVPDEILSEEIQTLNQEFDIIQQLSDTFMVSKSLMNTRLWQLN